MSQALSIKKLIGGGYDDFWTTRKFFRVCKGSKGSKKSKTSAYWYIYHMMKYPDANLLVVRRYFSDIHDSCFTDLLWAIDHLKVTHLWKATAVPMQITYEPTGQVILFRGLDDASKLASITVRKGVLCWMWIEEAYQITNEEEFEKLQMSLRGALPEGSGLFKQITLTFNPWSEHTWIKPRFFDHPDPDLVFNKTTTYKCNEWLDDDDRARYEELYVRNPKRARIVCDGDWGVSAGLIYENWVEKDFDIQQVLEDPDVQLTFGLDFGYAVSFNAFVAAAVNMKTRTLWVYDEMYSKGMSNMDIARRIIDMGYGKEHIIADAAEPKSIYELKSGFNIEVQDDAGHQVFQRYSLSNIRPAFKGPDSIRNGIQRLQSFTMVIHPKCENMIMELSNYSYDTDAEGNFTDKPAKEWDHLCLPAGTRVLTPEGEVPIESLKEGDLVLSHLGPKPVLASAMTGEDQEVWRLEFEDGTFLEATPNHPVVTTSGVRYLCDISYGDTVIKWSDQADATIPTPNTSSTTGYSGTDTPSQRSVPRDATSDTITDTSTDTSGRSTTGLFQKGCTSITSTETLGTTTSQTSDYSRPSNTGTSIPIPKNCTNGEGNTSPRTRTSAEPGTVQKRGEDGTASTQRTRTSNQSSSLASCAEYCLRQSLTEQSSSAQTPVSRLTAERWGLTTRRDFVSTVVKSSLSADTPRPGPVPVRVLCNCGIVRRADVYDISVADAHDFYANNVLVCNCDALRYSMEKFFIRGHGRVAEAKGVDGVTAQQTERKCRRVVSTI